jgi:hypothetical protein
MHGFSEMAGESCAKKYPQTGFLKSTLGPDSWWARGRLADLAGAKQQDRRKLLGHGLEVPNCRTFPHGVHFRYRTSNLHVSRPRMVLPAARRPSRRWASTPGRTWRGRLMPRYRLSDGKVAWKLPSVRTSRRRDVGRRGRRKRPRATNASGRTSGGEATFISAADLRDLQARAIETRQARSVGAGKTA